MTIDRHDVTATIGGQAVTVLEASSTVDRSWAPYAQGKLTIVAPELLSVLDPTRREPVTIRHSRRFSDSLTVAQVSALHAGETVAQVSAMHAGKTVEQMSSAYRTAWNPAGPHGAAPALTLAGWVTNAQRSMNDPDVWEIEWCGDEQRAITRLATTPVWDPGAANVRGIVANALGRAGLDQTLGGTGDLVVDLDEDGRAPVWIAGVSCWDYLDPIVSAAGMRLYADEAGQWLLTDDTDPAGTIELQGAVLEGDEAWETDGGRFFDHAVIVYEWETKAGSPRRSVDAYAAGWTSGYTETIPGRPARDGRARRIVEHSLRRARAQVWSTPADYTIRPGQTVTITAAGVSGTVDSVTWDYSSAQASITLIDVNPL